MAFSLGSGFGGASNNQSSIFGAPKPAGSIFGAPGQSAQQQATGSLFGQPPQQQPTGGIFGQPVQQQQQPQQSGGLFGQPSQQQQPATNIFGQQQQQQPTVGLFGQPNTQPAGGGLFGQTNTQPTGSLFGQSTTQPAGGSNLLSQSTTQQAGGGLFGQSTTQQTGGNIFGQSTTQTGGGGLFGQSTTQPAGGGTFSQPTQQQPQQGSSLFGSSNTQQQPNTSIFGNTLQAQPTVATGGFGGGFFSNNQPQQNLNATQSSNAPLFSKSTKFNDLPDEIKRSLENLDAHIQGRVQISKDLHQRKLGDEAIKAQELLRGIRKDLDNISTQTRNDLHFTKDMKVKVEQAVQDTIVATRIVEGFRAPQGNGASYLKDHASFPLEFFARVSENMKQRLIWYKSTIEQIERKLSSSAGQSQTPQGISATLQAQHATFLSLASKTAALDADLQKIKTIYTQLWRAKTGSVRDPFNQLDRTSDSVEYGMQSLGVK